MRMRLAMGLAGGLLLLTGCSGATGPGAGALSPSVSAPTSETAGPTPGSTRAPGPEGLDVTALVGNWFVTGKDAEPGLTVTVAPDEFRVWQKCGAAFAPWRASPSGLFAATVSAWSGSCDTRPDLPWLLTATRWQPDVIRAWLDRLLVLPPFLREGQGRTWPSRDDIAAGFALTGHFLTRHVYEARGIAPPDTRAAFVAAVMARDDGV